MPHFECSKNVNYTPEQMFNLVMDIEAYPEFLPWCIDAKIISRTNENLIADLNIQFNFMSQKYRSIITTSVDFDDKHIVDIESKHTIFKYLRSKWVITKQSFGSQIEYVIDFKFRSAIFEQLITLFFEHVSSKIISKFEERAKKIYSVK